MRVDYRTDQFVDTAWCTGQDRGMTSVQPEHNASRDGAAGPHDGGDVARDPDAIQREIEQTRAELADTSDAIADRLSPKRAAARGSQAVKAQVSSVLHHSENHSGAGPLLADGSSDQRRLRPDRVLIAVGVVAAIGVGIGFWRRHRR
jgi:Protein of unknown function (DUF3618)